MPDTSIEESGFGTGAGTEVGCGSGNDSGGLRRRLLLLSGVGAVRGEGRAATTWMQAKGRGQSWHLHSGLV